MKQPSKKVNTGEDFESKRANSFTAAALAKPISDLNDSDQSNASNYMKQTFLNRDLEHGTVMFTDWSNTSECAVSSFPSFSPTAGQVISSAPLPLPLRSSCQVMKNKVNPEGTVLPGAYQIGGRATGERPSWGFAETEHEEETQYEQETQDPLEPNSPHQDRVQEVEQCAKNNSIVSAAEPKKKRKTKMIIFILLPIVVLAIILGVGFSLKSNDQPQLDNQSTEQCEHASTEEFSIALKRCFCNEGLSDIPVNQIDEYNMIKKDFLKNNILQDFDYNTTSCELPNIVLHWLAEHNSKTDGFMDDNLSERYALALFFLSLAKNRNHDGWKSTNGWMTETSICGWFGIACDENGEVTRISLEGNGLYGEVPGEISLLRRLEFFDLNNNLLTGFIPSEIGLLTTATKIRLDKNQIQGTISSEIGQLTLLEYLDLSNNLVTGFIPTEIGLLTTATVIRLGKNEIQGTIPSEIGQLALLEYLDLGYNIGLSGSLPTTLGSCTSLEALGVERADLSGTIPTEFGRLNKLEILQLSTNIRMEGFIPTDIGLCTSLREVFMHDCKFSGSIPSEIGKLSNLEKLHLYNNFLNGSIPPTIGLDQTQLQLLQLAENLLSGSIPTELGLLSNLEILNVDENRLKGSIPSELGLCTNLDHIIISNNVNIQGMVPWELGDLAELEVFHFENTGLEGTLPKEICELPNVTTLEGNCYRAFTCSCCTRCH